MRRLLTGAIKLSFIAAAIFIGGAGAQDAPDRETRNVPRAERQMDDEPQFNSLLAVIIVNDNGDATDAAPGDGICETAAGNGICTLRAAVAEANVLAGDDTITFDPSVTDIQVNGQIAITSNMSLIGNGPASLTVRNVAALSTTSRIFNITNFVVSLSGMTLTDGNVTGNGGAIQNTGNLTVSNVIVRQNTASAVGGGIRSTNNLTLYRSTVDQNRSTASTSGGISFAGVNLTVAYSSITNNTSFGNGGGLNSSATGSMTIRNSTISGNTAGASSGGMFANRGAIINSTISGNTANGALATDGGGGLRFQAGANTISIVSSTITNNTAPNTTAGARSGIWHETGTLILVNSIVAGNVAQDIQRDGTGVITSGGFNLIGENTSVTNEFPAGSPSGTNYVGTEKAPINALLGALADNGGPTQTHLPMEGSLAIDNGSASGSAIDQRGFARPFDVPSVPNSPSGDGSDIGAVEAGSAPAMGGATVSGRVRDSSGRSISHVRILLTDSAGNSFSTVAGTFGNFTFSQVPIGASYIVYAYSREFEFSPIVINVDDNISGLDIVALP